MASRPPRARTRPRHLRLWSWLRRKRRRKNHNIDNINTRVPTPRLRWQLVPAIPAQVTNDWPTLTAMGWLASSRACVHGENKNMNSKHARMRKGGNVAGFVLDTNLPLCGRFRHLQYSSGAHTSLLITKHISFTTYHDLGQRYTLPLPIHTPLQITCILWILRTIIPSTRDTFQASPALRWRWERDGSGWYHIIQGAVGGLS